MCRGEERAEPEADTPTLMLSYDPEVSRYHGNSRSQPSFLGVISYNPYIGGLKPSFFHGLLGSKGIENSKDKNLWEGSENSLGVVMMMI